MPAPVPAGIFPRWLDHAPKPLGVSGHIFHSIYNVHIQRTRRFTRLRLEGAKRGITLTSNVIPLFALRKVRFAHNL